MHFLEHKTIVVLGSTGGIGKAICEYLNKQNCTVIIQHRGEFAFAGSFKMQINLEEDWLRFSNYIHTRYTHIDGVINCLGLLHNDTINPEKSFKHYDLQNMLDIFSVNTVSTAMAAKYLLPLFDRKSESVFASLGAKVGSIDDNKIGGWGSYRASKAALNMIMKNILIELTQKKINCRVLSIHPGTCKTQLSDPYSKNVKHIIHSPDEAAINIMKVIEQQSSLNPDFIKNWDGTSIKP